MAVCTVPFALLQPFFYGDYLTPILSYFNPLLLVCILFLVVSKLSAGKGRQAPDPRESAM